MPAEKAEFLFTEGEFEDDGFLAASFVSKYRRVTSTESLKEELLVYSNALKQQLYDIINRDYKDFITISTKLDGVDERVAILKKPLRDLQTNMSIFHEGVLSSMQALQDKIKERSEVSNKKTMVTTLLECIEQVEVIHRVLHHSNNVSTASRTTSSSSSSCKRENLLKLLDRKLASSSSGNGGGSSSTNMIKRDIFICSEYERAAYCLQSLQSNIVAIAPLINSSNNIAIEKLFSQLKSQCSELTVVLVEKIKSKLSHILSSVALKTSSESAVSSEEKVDHSVSYSHCIRVLLVLSKGDVAESVVRLDVIEPFVKQFLTAGRIDGKGGRGSYLGLQHALESIVTAICESQLKVYLDITENLISLSSFGSVDILTNGIYGPILTILSERCTSMYSIAIANTLSSCYTAINAFHGLFYQIVSSIHSNAARTRIMNSHYFIEFHKKWKLDMYYSLRYNEIANRVDKICDVVTATLNKSGTQCTLLSLYNKNLVDHIYDAPVLPSQSAALPPLPTKGETPAKQASHSPAMIVPAITMTLSQIDYDELKSSVVPISYHYSLFTLFSLELLTTVHSKVALQPLVHKFVSFVVKINIRLENHIRSLCEVNSLFSSDVTNDNPSTPTKKNVSSGSLSQSPLTVASSTGNLPAAGASQSTHGSSLHLSLDELIFMIHDLFNFTSWLNDFLKQKVLNLLLSSSGLSQSVEKSCGPLDKSFRILSDRLSTTSQSVFTKLTAILISECRQPIAGAVKAIAGKYRMTNKPPPDTPSQYVEQILQPLRVFLATHDKILNQLFTDKPTTSSTFPFVLQVVNESAAYLLEHVRLLIDSVKQQDSTLMRRTKLAAAATKAGALSDTEKIILQLQLDVKSFGTEICNLCKCSTNDLNILVHSYPVLLEEVNEANSKLKESADK